MIQGRLHGRKDRWRACRKSGLHGQCVTAGRTRSEVKTKSGRLRLQYTFQGTELGSSVSNMILRQLRRQ